MKDSTFSKKTRHMLEDNGYSFRHNESIYTFKHSSGAAIGVIVVAAMVAIFNIVFIVIHPIPGLIAFGLLIVATITVVKKLVGKTLIMIDNKDKTFTINTPTYSRGRHAFETVLAITLKSKYVDEYTSAFKNTSEEHLVTIHLNLDSGRNIMLFKFSSDYAEPTPEINEVYSFLKNSFKGKRSLNS
jgi:ABC-type protease/lipase transport system fused ATPase/permease subunit